MVGGNNCLDSSDVIKTHQDGGVFRFQNVPLPLYSYSCCLLLGVRSSPPLVVETPNKNSSFEIFSPKNISTIRVSVFNLGIRWKISCENFHWGVRKRGDWMKKAFYLCPQWKCFWYQQSVLTRKGQSWCVLSISHIFFIWYSRKSIDRFQFCPITSASAS